MLLALTPVAWGAEGTLEGEGQLSAAVGLDALQSAAGAYLNGYLNAAALTGADLGAGAGAILNGQRAAIPGILKEVGRSGAMLMLVALLCGLAGSVKGELGFGGLDPYRLAGAAAVCAIAVVDVNSMMSLGREALEQMKSFSALLLPTVTAACAAAGAPASAVARQGAALIFFDLLISLSERFLLPLVYAYIAAVTAAAALDNDGLRRLGGLIKGACTGLLTGLLTLFVFYLTFTGAVAGNADALAQKAAKTALSGMVPVVGSILSDAAETVVAGAGVLKGTVGVVGLLAVLAICLTPFLRLGLHYIAYKCAAALSATAAPGFAAGLIDAIGSAFALMVGMVGGSGVILYVALVTSVKAVGG